MHEYTYNAGDGTSPEIWREGTSFYSVSKSETAHTSYGTSNYTNDYTALNTREDVKRWTFAASSSGAGFTGNSSGSEQEFNHFVPSTTTEFMPGYSDSGGTYPASTATITNNYTILASSHRTSEGGSTVSTADTSYSERYTEASGATYNGEAQTPDTNTVTTIAFEYTYRGASSFVSSQTYTVDYVTTTTSIGETVGKYIISTLSTNSTQSKAWILSAVTTATTGKFPNMLTTPVTYAGDYVTYGTELSSNTGGTYSTPVTTDTITNHVYSKKINTVVLLHGERGGDDWNRGDMLWHFTGSGLNATASTTGRFTDFFASTGGATVTLEDYEKYYTNSVAITDITISENTANTSITTVTGSSTVTGTGTASAITVVSSKNGASWSYYESFNTTVNTGTGSGTAATVGSSAAASNTVYFTNIFSIGDVGTSLSTYSYGSSTVSGTFFTHSVQVTGYSDFSWTSTTETAGFYSTSFVESRLALYSSVSSSMDIVLRSTTADTVLIYSHSSYMGGTDTSYFLLGSVSTITTRVFEVATTTSRSVYDAAFHNEVQNYTTESSYSLAGGGNGETYAVSEYAHITKKTEYRLEPRIIRGGGELHFARFSALPHGFAGFGGTFDASGLDVFLTVNVGLAAGNAFSGQSIHSDDLSTVLAYPNVTFFPVDPALKIAGKQARYVSALDSIGTASIAATWTSTTTTTGEVTTAVTSRFATYTAAAATPINGTFYSDEPLSIFTDESFQLCGGYAVGNNALGNPYTVYAASGFAAWTIGTASYSTSATGGSVSFTVAGDKAINFLLEPIFTAKWTGDADTPYYFSSTPYR
jgi:hypothetical protein